MDKLIAQAGNGDLVGHVVVDQAYAQNQHQSFWFNHPDGGKPFYLRDPLFANAARYMQMVADTAITRRGLEPEKGMADAMENLSDRVYDEAPWEFADLRASGHPFVTDGQHTVYDRTPHVHRLSKAELRIKAELRQLFDPDRYKK